MSEFLSSLPFSRLLFTFLPNLKNGKLIKAVFDESKTALIFYTLHIIARLTFENLVQSSEIENRNTFALPVFKIRKIDNLKIHFFFKIGSPTFFIVTEVQVIL